jgi:hypothetical protein
MTKPPRAPNAGVLDMAASGGSKSSTPAEITRAERAFENAKAHAQMVKQGEIAAAHKLKMPEHQVVIRAAERKYHLALAAAADASGGIIASQPYHSAAAV